MSVAAEIAQQATLFDDTIDQEQVVEHDISVIDTEKDLEQVMPDSKQLSLQEQLKQQREKQYYNMLRVEQQNNNQLSASINNIQDTEMVDLIKMVDTYMNRCLTMIDSSDSVITVRLKNSTNPAANLSKKPETQMSSVSLNTLQTITSNPQGIDYLRKIKSESSICIDALLPLDYLRNHLKTGNPFLQQPPSDQPTNNKDSKANNPAAQSSKSQSPMNTSILSFKYLLVLDLNKNMFKFQHEKQSSTARDAETLIELVKINLPKRPESWSHYDFDQLSLDVLLNKRARQYDTTSKHRYLNSRALFDRIHQYFNRVLKTDFPTRFPPSTSMAYLSKKRNAAKKLNETSSTSNFKDDSLNNKKPGDENDKKRDSKTSNRTEALTMNTTDTIISQDPPDRTCSLKNNQLIVNFKLDNSFKTLRYLNVCVVVEIAVRYEENEPLNVYINETVRQILDKFGRSTSRKQSTAASHEFQTYELILSKLLKTNHSEYLLSPSLLHYWCIDIRQTKLNLIKYLTFIHSIPSSYSLDELLTWTEERRVRYGLVYSSVVTNSSAPISVYFKILQNFLQTCLVTFLVENNFLDILHDSSCSLQYEIEDLVTNMLFDSLFHVSLSEEYFEWSSDVLFDELLWPTLLRLRVYIFEKYNIPDPFNFVASLMPSFLLKLGGYLTFNKSHIYSVPRPVENLKATYENNMRQYFKLIVGEEIIGPPDDTELDVAGMTEEDKSLRVVKDLKKPTASRRSNPGSPQHLEDEPEEQN